MSPRSIFILDIMVLVTWSVFVQKYRLELDVVVVPNIYLSIGVINDVGVEWDMKIYSNLNFYDNTHCSFILRVLLTLLRSLFYFFSVFLLTYRIHPNSDCEFTKFLHLLFYYYFDSINCWLISQLQFYSCILIWSNLLSLFYLIHLSTWTNKLVITTFIK